MRENRIIVVGVILITGLAFAFGASMGWGPMGALSCGIVAIIAWRIATL